MRRAPRHQVLVHVSLSEARSLLYFSPPILLSAAPVVANPIARLESIQAYGPYLDLFEASCLPCRHFVAHAFRGLRQRRRQPERRISSARFVAELRWRDR